MIKTTCKSCGNNRSFDDSFLGRKFKCPSCGKPVTISPIDTGISPLNTEKKSINTAVSKEEIIKNTENLGNNAIDTTINPGDVVKSPEDTENSTIDTAINTLGTGISTPKIENKVLIPEGNSETNLVDTVESTIDSGNSNMETETKVNIKNSKPDFSISSHYISQKTVKVKHSKKYLLIITGILIVGLSAFFLIFNKTLKTDTENTGITTYSNFSVSSGDSSSNKNSILLKTDSLNNTEKTITDTLDSYITNTNTINRDSTNQLDNETGKSINIPIDEGKISTIVKEQNNIIDANREPDKFIYLTLNQIKNDLLNKPLCEGLTYIGEDQKIIITGGFPDKVYQKKLDLYGNIKINITFKDESENKSCTVEIFYKKDGNKFDLVTYAEK